MLEKVINVVVRADYYTESAPLYIVEQRRAKKFEMEISWENQYL